MGDQRSTQGLQRLHRHGPHLGQGEQGIHPAQLQCQRKRRIQRNVLDSTEYNICISDAQYYESSAQQNLWCEILEF